MEGADVVDGILVEVDVGDVPVVGDIAVVDASSGLFSGATEDVGVVWTTVVG